MSNMSDGMATPTQEGQLVTKDELDAIRERAVRLNNPPFSTSNDVFTLLSTIDSLREENERLRELIKEDYAKINTEIKVKLDAAEARLTKMREELLRQWERNHIENCSYLDQCSLGQYTDNCHWPIPEVLGMSVAQVRAALEEEGVGK